jgi:hypothetical protein
MTRSQVLSTLGVGAIGESDLARARACFTESLALLEGIASRRSAGYQLTHLGLLARLEGDTTAARRWYAAGLPHLRDAGDRPSLAWALEEWAGLATAEGQPARAARLFGAAQALFEALGQRRQPYLGPNYERDLAATRAALDGAAFASAWAEGNAMPLEQAVADALADAGGPARA